MLVQRRRSLGGRPCNPTVPCPYEFPNGRNHLRHLGTTQKHAAEPKGGISAPRHSDLKRLDPPVRRRILKAIDGVAAEPAVGDVRRLSGRPELRLHVGDWRVLFERTTSTRTLMVLRVLPRGRAYRE